MQIKFIEKIYTFFYYHINYKSLDTRIDVPYISDIDKNGYLTYNTL